VHIDTGALYRGIAFLAIQACEQKRGEKGGEDQAALETAAIELARQVKLEFRRLPEKNPSNRLFANGRDVTEFIRTPEVSMASSRISAVPEVRSALLGLQRALGSSGHAILEGRDIGTVVFPNADIKFFLTAAVDERAKRRLAELEVAGADAPSFEELKSQILERDRGDTTRSVAPLRKALDAIELDTSDLTLDEVVAKMEGEVRARLGLEPTNG
jgi:cytidylate kinase